MALNLAELPITRSQILHSIQHRLETLSSLGTLTQQLVNKGVISGNI
jgi:hypothetical protein